VILLSVTLKTLNEVVQSIINHIHDKIPNADTKEGTFLRDVFIDPISDEIVGLNIDMKMLEYSQSILTAEGEDLDRLASNYNVTRKTPTKSNGFIRFYIKSPNSDFVIKLNTTLSTKATYTNESRNFVTDNTKDIYYVSPTSTVDTIENADLYTFIFKENLTLDSNGYYYYDINATSENTGSIYNVSSNLVTQRVSSIDNNIISFTNPIPFTGAIDEETDQSLVLRIKLALQGANIGTRYGYMSYVLKQEGVIAAKIVAAGDSDMIRDNKDGGKVDIYIKGSELQDSNTSFVLSEDNTSFDGDDIYTTLPILNKPINDLISITYKKLNDNTPYYFKNVNNFEYENILTEFIPLDDYEFNDINVKESILNILNDYDFMTTTKDYNYNNEQLTFEVFGTLDKDSEFKYYKTIYSEFDEESGGTNVYYPFMFTLYKDNDRNNVKIIFIFGHTTNGTDYYEENIFTIVQNKDNNNDDKFYIYNDITDIKNYFKDTLLTYNILFSVNNDEEITHNETIDNSVNNVYQDDGLINSFINYLLDEEVKNNLLYNLDYIKKILLNYKYCIDCGMMDILTKSIYVKPYMYVYNQIIDDYLVINIKLSNNPNITNGYFTLTIDNSNNLIDVNDYICENNITIMEQDTNIIIDYDFIRETDSMDKSISVLEIKFKRNSLIGGLSCVLSNVHLYNRRNVYQCIVHNSTVEITEDIESFDQFDINTEKLILFKLKEYYINTECYKIDIVFPIEYNETIYDIPLSIVKKIDNLYIRVYYEPDYELVNTNEYFMGNSVNSIYKIKWFNNPLDILDGNLPIDISYNYNNLIKTLQNGVEQVKCLTADVLVKEAIKCKIEVVVNVNFDSSYDIDEVKNNIIDKVTQYINNVSSLGGTIRRVNIVVLIQQTEGVTYLDSCNMELRKLYGENQTIITLQDNEYFELSNIIINTI